jgi:hypothetical protein
MVAQIIPVQWPVKAIPKFATLAVANTPVLLMPTNPKRAFFSLSNDMVTYTLVVGVVTYTRFDGLYFSFGKPMAGGNNGTGFLGEYLAPGAFEPSLFGGISQQEIWVWSLLAGGAPWTIVGYEGVNDPDFNPSGFMPGI